jgi:hypothetical protein
MKCLQTHAIATIEQVLLTYGEHRGRTALNERAPPRKARQDRLQVLATQPPARLENHSISHASRRYDSSTAEQ